MAMPVATPATAAAAAIPPLDGSDPGPRSLRRRKFIEGNVPFSVKFRPKECPEMRNHAKKSCSKQLLRVLPSRYFLRRRLLAHRARRHGRHQRHSRTEGGEGRAADDRGLPRRDRDARRPKPKFRTCGKGQLIDRKRDFQLSGIPGTGNVSMSCAARCWVGVGAVSSDRGGAAGSSGI